MKARLGFHYRNQPLSKEGYLLPSYIPTSGDGYALSAELGTADNTFATVANGFIQYTINGGSARGQLGKGSSQPCLKFDSTGAGNYGEDYIGDGTSYEVYGFYINGTTYIGGDNASEHTNAMLSGSTTMWNKSSGNIKHIICKRGDSTNGFVVVQYMTRGVEPLIRIKMSYTNTTGSSATVKCFRGFDPDLGGAGVFNTNNYRGYGSIAASDIVVGEDQSTKTPVGIYVPGDGYTHNTAIISAWPTIDTDSMLSGTDNGNGDRALYAAWDLGTIADGATVSVHCYYVLGANKGKVLDTIG